MSSSTPSLWSDVPESKHVEDADDDEDEDDEEDDSSADSRFRILPLHKLWDFDEVDHDRVMSERLPYLFASPDSPLKFHSSGDGTLFFS